MGVILPPVARPDLTDLLVLQPQGENDLGGAFWYSQLRKAIGEYGRVSFFGVTSAAVKQGAVSRYDGVDIPISSLRAHLVVATIDALEHFETNALNARHLRTLFESQYGVIIDRVGGDGAFGARYGAVVTLTPDKPWEILSAGVAANAIADPDYYGLGLDLEDHGITYHLHNSLKWEDMQRGALCSDQSRYQPQPRAPSQPAP